MKYYSKKDESGMVTLEACISVLFFMIVMFLFYGLFVMYMAQTATAHAVLQTSQSLAVDNYAANKLEDGANIPDSINGLKNLMVKFLKSTDLNLIPDNTNSFASNKKMEYDISGDDVEENVSEMAKKRFIAYLANGDDDKADSMLKNMNVENGLAGLDFSESKIEHGNLRVVLKYQLNYEFQIAELGKVQVKQESVSKLW